MPNLNTTTLNNSASTPFIVDYLPCGGLLLICHDADEDVHVTIIISVTHYAAAIDASTDWSEVSEVTIVCSWRHAKACYRPQR